MRSAVDDARPLPIGTEVLTRRRGGGPGRIPSRSQSALQASTRRSLECAGPALAGAAQVGRAMAAQQHR